MDGFVKVRGQANPSPFWFDHGDGSYIKILYNSTDVARISTGAPTAGGSRELFRCSACQGNYSNFPIVNVIGMEGGGEEEERFHPDKQLSAFGHQINATPNPFTDKIEVSIPFISEGSEVFMSLYDIQGNIVFSQQVMATSSQIQYLSTSSLPQGVYVLRVATGIHVESIRVLKTQ